MILGYPIEVTRFWIERLKVKVRVRVQQFVVGLNSMSAFYLLLIYYYYYYYYLSSSSTSYDKHLLYAMLIISWYTLQTSHRRYMLGPYMYIAQSLRPSIVQPLSWSSNIFHKFTTAIVGLLLNEFGTLLKRLVHKWFFSTNPQSIYRYCNFSRHFDIHQ